MEFLLVLFATVLVISILSRFGKTVNTPTCKLHKWVWIEAKDGVEGYRICEVCKMLANSNMGERL